ncbi:MAG: hypothetical protein IJ105_01350 [Bacilli bacterium]|nr:hypothetical protein [Bacilli bacterium]
MKDLIEALKIFEKYIGDEKYPTWAEHDEFGVCCRKEIMTEEDIKKLDELGFFYDENYDCFVSFKYGSC